MQKEEFHSMLEALPEDMRHNPKVFFRTTKAVAKLKKTSVLVQAFDEAGTTVSKEEGVRRMIADLYCPPKTPYSGLVGRSIRDKTQGEQGEHVWKLTPSEVREAIRHLSWKKATGVDGMADVIIHEMVTKGTEEERKENLVWLTGRLEK
jgi:hypothetical protein